jgi:hypothetical protein
MTEPTSAQDLFKGRHFDQEISVLCIGWYLTFKLSSRDLVQMMGERGIALAHTTILRWVQPYVPEFEKRWSRYARKALAIKRSAAAARPAWPKEGSRSSLRWSRQPVTNIPTCP